ncbi:MAG: hypothetical protein ACYTGL_08900 [Planctomycetota bacterium]
MVGSIDIALRSNRLADFSREAVAEGSIAVADSQLATFARLVFCVLTPAEKFCRRFATALPNQLFRLSPSIAFCLVLAFVSLASADPGDYFRIQVVDDETGRGVPLVELKTVHGVSYWTDSTGVIAFHEPGLMDTQVFFGVSSHGYEFAADGFGIRGARLQTVPGTSATVKIKRLNLAERLYRITGGGIYRDSVLLGDDVPVQQPVLNAKVLGQDSVMNAVCDGRLYWFWGDTNRPKYPLGNFHVPGATSKLPQQGGLDPVAGVDLRYFIGPDGFAKETCRMPGPGPTWIDALTVVPDAAGNERMFARYVKVKPPLSIYERGVVEFNVETQLFEKRRTLSEDEFPQSGAHTFRHSEGGVEYAYLASPYPLVRVAATAEAFVNPARYESWSCFTAGSTADEYDLERDADGQLVWGWKRGTLVPTHQLEQKLLRSGDLKSDERYFRLQDSQSGKAVIAHRGTIAFNAYRDRWIMIFTEHFGTSVLGEVWYAEAPAPTGPWTRATKIVTHDSYSFYNPRHHPVFDQAGGRYIYFEGTYTHTFSGNDQRTPRYDYNQIMYRLDLAIPRLHAAEAR